MRFPLTYILLGEASKFDKLVTKLQKRPGVKDPAALAAWIGRENGKIEDDETENGPADGCDHYDDATDACVDEDAAEDTKTVGFAKGEPDDYGFDVNQDTVESILGRVNARSPRR